jgi:hypothetical protein
MKNYSFKIVLGVFLMAIAVGLALAFFNGKEQEKEANTPVDVIVRQHALYIELTQEERINRAEAIFVGKVTDISPTQWNQESGEHWQDGLLMHYMEVAVLQPIVDTIGLGRTVTITELGNSPIDVDTAEDRVVVAGSSGHNLAIGDQAVFFVHQTEIAWRGDPKPAVVLTGGAPWDAYFILEDDGLYHSGRFNESPLSLEQLIEQIAQRREVIVP